MEFVSPVWDLIDFILGVRSCLNSLGEQEEDIQFRKITIFLTRTQSHNVGHYKALNKYLMIWWITAISWKYVHALKFLRQYLSWVRYLLTTEFMRDLSREVGEYLGPTVTVWTHQVSSNLSMRYKTSCSGKSDYFSGCQMESLMLLACKIGSEIMIHHLCHYSLSAPDTATREVKRQAPKTRCKCSYRRETLIYNKLSSPGPKPLGPKPPRPYPNPVQPNSRQFQMEVPEVQKVRFQCDLCLFEATQKSHLVVHVKTKHKGEQYSCNQCIFKANYSQGLKMHVKVKHQGFRYSCNQCPFTTTQNSHLNTHIKSVHKEIKYDCDQCPFQATLITSIKRHIKSKHEGVRYPCNQCSFNATRRENLAKHTRFSHGKLEERVLYSCSQCTFKAIQRRSLKNHVECKHKNLTYTCDQCFIEVRSQAYLRQHVRSIHEKVEYCCDQCPYKTNHRTNLRQHVEIAHKLIRYPCDQCSFEATRKYNLGKHVQSNHRE